MFFTSAFGGVMAVPFVNYVPRAEPAVSAPPVVGGLGGPVQPSGVSPSLQGVIGGLGNLLPPGFGQSPQTTGPSQITGAGSPPPVASGSPGNTQTPLGHGSRPVFTPPDLGPWAQGAWRNGVLNPPTGLQWHQPSRQAAFQASQQAFGGHPLVQWLQQLFAQHAA